MEQTGGGGCLIILLALFGILGFAFVAPVGVETDMGMAPVGVESSQSMEGAVTAVPGWAAYPVYAIQDIACGTQITPELASDYPGDDINLKYATALIEADMLITPDLVSDAEPDCAP